MPMWTITPSLAVRRRTHLDRHLRETCVGERTPWRFMLARRCSIMYGVCMYVAPHVCRPRWQNKQTVKHFRTKRMDKLGWVVFIHSSVLRGRHLKQTIRHFRTQRMDKLGWVVSFTAVWRQTGTNPYGTTLHACRLSELRMTTRLIDPRQTDGREKRKKQATGHFFFSNFFGVRD